MSCFFVNYMTAVRCAQRSFKKCFRAFSYQSIKFVYSQSFEFLQRRLFKNCDLSWKRVVFGVAKIGGKIRMLFELSYTIIIVYINSGCHNTSFF